VNVLKVTKVQRAILNAGEATRALAAGMVFVLKTENAIAIMEERRIWAGVVETVRFHAMEDLHPFVHCTAPVTSRESAPAVQDSGHLIAA